MAYIHPDNQTLLWNTIQKAPHFEKLGENKSQWFKTIIRDFYENDGKNIKNQTDLQTINKSTIAYMVHSLKQLNTALPSSTGMNERISHYTEQFNDRQKEYELMNAKPHPPQIDQINEKIADEAITNMEELIRQQLNQREQELKMFGQQPATPLPVQPEKKSVQWRDESLKKEIDDLREIVMQLKEKVESLQRQLQEKEYENINKTI
jgi:hypothetical protein